MDTQVTFGIIAGCVALAAVLVLLSLHILRREPKDLWERWKKGKPLGRPKGLAGCTGSARGLNGVRGVGWISR